MRLLQILTIACIVVAPLDVIADAIVSPSERVVNHVNVRAGSEYGSEKIGTLEKGESLPYLRSVPRWYVVRLPDGREGYVSKSWTTVIGAPTSGAEMAIHHLNVGGGTCTLIKCPGSGAHPMLVDCGSRGGSRNSNDLQPDEAAARISKILGDDHLPVNVVLSHADIDHYGWVPDVLKNVSVASVRMGGDPNDYKWSGFPDWFEKQKAEGVPVYDQSSMGRHWHNDGEQLGEALSCGLASTYVLTVGSGGSKNAESLVLMVEYGEFAVIFPGDAEYSTEAQAMRNFPGGVKASVLSSSHHGTSTHGSNHPAWVDAVSPQVVIHSSGKLNGHPRCKATERYKDYLADVPTHDVRCGENNDDNNLNPVPSNKAEYVTSVSGEITVTTNGQSPLRVSCSRDPRCDASIPH